MLRLCKKVVYLIFLMFLLIFIGSSFFLRAKYNCFDYGDKPVLVKQRPGTFILLISVLLPAGFVLYGLALKLNRRKRKFVIPLVALLSFLLQLGIILAFTRLPTDDSKTVLTIALNMLYKNDYSSLKAPGYLHMFPFNMSTVFYLKGLLSLFPDNYLVLKIFNILFCLITTGMIYLIYKEINGKSGDNDYGVLIFAGTYLPALFMSNFIYNDSIATAFFTAAIYFTIKFIKKESMIYMFAAALMLSFGNYFRSLGLILLVAFGIYFLLNVKKIGWIKLISAFCIFLALVNVPGLTQNAILKSKNIISEPIERNAAPIHMWLNMGMNMENFGFWDNYRSYNIYRVMGKYNKEISKELFIESIRNQLIQTNYRDLLNMYYKKLIWTWTEGTYQIERYGLGLDTSEVKPGQKTRIPGGYCYSTFCTKLFSGGSIFRRGLLWVLYVVNFLMYCCILIRIFLSVINEKYNELLLVLVVLGFIGFYLLWEIKSRYIFPVYPILIVLSYMGFKDIYNIIFHRNKYLH